MFAMGAYTGLAITAFIVLVWQIRTAEWAIAAIAPVGAVLTFISLFTGAVWGKPMWGTWWEWDARLTSQLILFFLYVGVLALYYAFSDEIGRHTSELQSRPHLVCRLLLEKKKIYSLK